MLGLIDGSIGVGCGLLFLDGSVTQWAAHANEVGPCMFVWDTHRDERDLFYTTAVSPPFSTSLLLLFKCAKCSSLLL